MIIAQISDTHIALDAPDAQRRIDDFERTVADINALDPAPDVIVHTGDIVHNGTRAEYEAARAILAEAKAPVYVLVGNKDNRPNLRAAFSGHRYLECNSEFVTYAVDDYPVRLVVVDTLLDGSNKGGFCGTRAGLLTELIEADTSRPLALFAHHPPFEIFVGPDRFHFETSEMMELLRRTLLKFDGIEALFCGHVHRETFGAVGDIPSSVATAVATTLRRGEYPPEMKTRPIYQLHSFHPERGFATATRIVAGTQQGETWPQMVAAQ